MLYYFELLEYRRADKANPPSVLTLLHNVTNVLLWRKGGCVVD
jgi:hypothetical protein